MVPIIDQPTIRSAVDLLRFEKPTVLGSQFVDLTPSIPVEFKVLDDHDLSSNEPPNGMGVAQYAKMVPLYHVMNAALNEHDHNVIYENTQRFREDFWERFGECSIGADIMRKSYRRALAERLVELFERRGSQEILDLSEGKRMMDSIARNLS